MATPATPQGRAEKARPLTVLIGADTFAPHINGAARFTERLAAGLVQRGHDVHIAALNVAYRRANPRVEVIEGEPMTLHRLPAVRWLPHDWIRFVWPWRAKHYARQVLSRVQPDVVHIQSHIVIGRGLIRIARKRGIPVIATNHVMAENILDHTTLPAFIDRIILKWAWADARRTFQMARAVTTPTRRAEDFLEQTIDISGVIPISCGIDRSNYAPVVGARERHRLLIRRSSHRGEAGRRGAARGGGAGCDVRRGRRRRSAQEPRGPHRQARAHRPGDPPRAGRRG